jgi:hypothetical protein
MNRVDVYGFGSFFKGSIAYSDIDLLLVHNDRSKDSCALAISCKRELQSMRENLHITMLSKQAEQSFLFLETARAQHLGHIEKDIDGQSIQKIVASIQLHSMPDTGTEKE